MKKKLLLGAFIGLFTVTLTFGQKIPQSQVPSVIVNQFQQDFQGARDIEWKQRPGYYEVEFEIGRPDKDHEIWYDSTGKILYHKQEIAKGDLPAKVISMLNADFKRYRIRDVKKIDQAGKITYKMEAKSITEEWDLIIDAQGKILSKIAD